MAQAKKTSDSKTATKPTDERELIRELAGLLDETNLTEIEVEREGLRVRVVRGGGIAAPVPSMQPAAVAPACLAATAVATSPSTRAWCPRRWSAPPISRPSPAPSRSSMSAARWRPERRS